MVEVRTGSQESESPRGGSPRSDAPGRSPTSGEARSVAVIGAKGALGTHLVGLLEDSPRVGRVVAIDTEAPASRGPKTQHYAADLSSERLEHRLVEILDGEEVSTVVHLGFETTPSHDPDESHQLESVGTMHVVAACRRTRVRKLVMPSSTYLYGASPKNPCYLEESHPLCAPTSEPFFRDKMQAERDALRFGLPGRGTITTILRMAPIVGPNSDNFMTRYLAQSLVPTVLGFDPLLQFLHEADAAAALRRAVEADVPGVFNVAGPGVIPLSKVVRLVGKHRLPMTRPISHLVVGGLWLAHQSPIPPTFLDFVQYACVGDTDVTRRMLGFVPMFSSREAILDFASAQSLRDVQLLSETPA